MKPNDIWKKRLRQRPRSPRARIIQKLLLGFEKSQWKSPEEIQTSQFSDLSRFLSHAQQSVAHYAQALPPGLALDPASLRGGSWLDVPVLKRATVNQLGDKLLSNAIPKDHGNLDPIYTSGTTGRPVRVVRSAYALNYWRAITSRDHVWHDRDIKGTLAVIRSSKKGDSVYPKGSRHMAWGSKDGVFRTGPCIALNVNTAIPDMVEWLVRNNPRHLLTLPNIVTRLASYCLEKDIRLPNLRDVQTHGESCGDHVHEMVRDAWDIPVHDIYSGREVGYMALQCPENQHYHIQSEGSCVEVLNEQDQPCKIGEIGRVVVSTFRNYAMPLIRYEVGDLAIMGDICSCGRGLPVLTEISGRQQDLLILPNGEQRATLFGSPDVKAFMELAPIEQYQFAHIARDELEVRLAVKRDLTAAEESKIATWVHKKHGYPFKIRFAYFDEIARTSAGKFKDFVREF